jgi:hypothetical protein
MQRILTLSFLALLALGFASQLQAQVRIQCPRCQSLDTYGHYKCLYCPGSVEWDSAAYSNNGLPPPYQTRCYQCSTLADAVYCWDPDCTKALPFWP